MWFPMLRCGKAVLLLATLMYLAGCQEKELTKSAGEAAIGGVKVTFAIDGEADIATNEDSATVTYPEGEVVVEKSGRVLVNDLEVATLPENTQAVEVQYTAGTLRIVADGVELAFQNNAY